MKKFGIMDVLTGLLSAQNPAGAQPFSSGTSASQSQNQSGSQNTTQKPSAASSASPYFGTDKQQAYVKFVCKHNQLSRKIDEELKKRQSEDQKQDKNLEILRLKRLAILEEQEKLRQEEQQLMARRENLKRLLGEETAEVPVSVKQEFSDAKEEKAAEIAAEQPPKETAKKQQPQTAKKTRKPKTTNQTPDQPIPSIEIKNILSEDKAK